MKQNHILILLKVIIAAAFILSAISKIVSPGYFEITLVDQGLLPTRDFASYATRIFIIIELALGLLILQSNYLKNLILPSVALLILVFSTYLIILIFQGDDQNCGCFSSLIFMNPIEALIKNLILLVISYYLFKKVENSSNRRNIPISMILFSIVIVLFFAPIKSADNFIFSKFSNFSQVGRVDLAEGSNLVAIFDANCEHCMETAIDIRRTQSEAKNFPKVYNLIFSENLDDIKTFQKETETNFPFHQITVDEFFDLIGNSPPRIYLLENGEIIEVMDDKFEEKLWDRFRNPENQIMNFHFE